MLQTTAHGVCLLHLAGTAHGVCRLHLHVGGTTAIAEGLDDDEENRA